jgi:hypothetical protein
MGFSFLSYDGICDGVALVVCPLLGDSGLGIEPKCYSRNVEINSTLIFQPGESAPRRCLCRSATRVRRDLHSGGVDGAGPRAWSKRTAR